MAGRPFLVAIGGGTASGKGTLAEALASPLGPEGVETVAIDAFMRRGDPDAPTFQFQHTGQPTFDANHLNSFDVSALAAKLDSLAGEVAIVEGHFALVLEEVRDRADLKIFVDLEADVRALRRLERDVRIGRSNGDPALIMAYYLECARLGHERYVEPSRRFADLIVRGDADFSRLSGILAGTIQALICKLS